MSSGPIGAQHLSNAPRDDRDRDLTSLRARTLHPMPIPTPAPQDDLQRVPAAPNGHPRTLVPPSKQPDQRESHSLGIQTLLNPVEGENRSNESSTVGSPSLSELSTGLLVPTRSHAHSLPSARSSPYRQVNQEAPYSQAQNREHPCTVKPGPLQPTSQRDSASTQYSSYSQFNQTESAITPPAVSTGQPQYFSSNLSSGPSSTMVQMLPGAKAFKVPTSSPVTQSQYQMMVVETERGFVQVPVDVHTASKDADKKRRRNAAASQRFRQRRKEKEQKTSENIAELEAQVREMEEERDHYRTERDHFRSLAFRHRLPVAPRPPTPKRQQHAAMNGASLVQNQEFEGDGQNGGHTRQCPGVPSQGLPPSAAWPPLQIPLFS